MIRVVGWDVGGANIKAASIMLSQDEGELIRVTSRPFEIWREKERFPEVLREIYSKTTVDGLPQSLAVTMTAELSDVFLTKRQGVMFILDGIRTCFPDLACYVMDTSGKFIPIKDAIDRPLDFSATNWLASAQWIAQEFPNCLLVDVGSTTTDISPILDGEVCVVGRTDLERLSSGELVFTGALRTNVAAIVGFVPVRGRLCRVASEYFAISGDVHLILGHMDPQDYSCTTPDGQPPSMDSARRRLARLVCADAEMMSASEIDEMARYIHREQIRQICEGIDQVLSRTPRLRRQPVAVLGTGGFLGSAAAESLGLKVLELENHWTREELAVAPCIAAAFLLAGFLKAEMK